METLVIAGLIFASGTDWKYRKIPNVIPFTLALLGFILSFSKNGWEGAVQSIAGMVTGCMLLYIPFSLGGMGGGDVKLLAAIGACLGPSQVFEIFLAAAIAGGVLALIEVTRQKAWAYLFESFKNRFIHFALSGRLAKESRICFNTKPLYIPYAIAIALGYLGLLSLGGH